MRESEYVIGVNYSWPGVLHNDKGKAKTSDCWSFSQDQAFWNTIFHHIDDMNCGILLDWSIWGCFRNQRWCDNRMVQHGLMKVPAALLL